MSVAMKQREMNTLLENTDIIVVAWWNALTCHVQFLLKCMSAWLAGWFGSC